MFLHLYFSYLMIVELLKRILVASNNYAVAPIELTKDLKN